MYDNFDKITQKPLQLLIRLLQDKTLKVIS